MISRLLVTLVFILALAPSAFSQDSSDPNGSKKETEEKLVNKTTEDANKATEDAVKDTSNEVSTEEVKENVKEEVNEEVKPESSQKFERVQVTGSLIRRADFEGPSPIQIIDRKSLDESAFNSVGDYLRELPVSNTGSTRESSGRVGADASSIDLRGLGASNTLVLMNNMRLPSDPTTGFFDIGLIPEIAIETTTILKDGASATYGSDAVGGVVNLTTRKNFTGIEANIRQGIAEEKGGNKTDVGVIGGFEFGGFGPVKRGSVTAAAQYRFNQRIYDRDRIWSRPSPVDSPKNIGWSAVGDVATYIPYDFNNPEEFSSDRNYIESQCDAAGYKVFGDGGGKGFCGFPFAFQSDQVPEIQQLSAYLNTEFEFSSRSVLDITAVATKRLAEWTFAPSPGQPSNGFTIPSAVADTLNAGSPLPGITAGQDVGFFYRTTEFGPRVSEIETSAVTVVSAFKHEFNETAQWNTTASFTYTDRKDDGVSGYALATPFIEAVRSGAYNPFDPNRDVSGLLSDVQHQTFQYSKSNMIMLDTNVNGELFSFLDKGLFSGAIGAQYFGESFDDRADAESIPSLKPDGTIRSDVFGSAATSGEGSRDVGAAYGELAITYGTLAELQLAARYDNYSDFGNSLIPKVGLKVRPFSWLMFRGSFSQAFKAPLLTSLYQDASEGNPTYIDYVACDNAGGTPNDENFDECLPRQRRNVNVGNENLKQEESDIFGLGIIVEPIKRLAISVDYWKVSQSNVVGGGTGLVLQEMTRAELEQGTDPNDTPGVQINRSANGNNEINFTQVGALNLGKNIAEGLDFEVSYSLDTKIGSFSLNNTYSRTFRREVEAFPGVGVRDFSDAIGSPLWRNRMLLSYAPVRGHSFSFVVNSTASQNKSLDNPASGRIPDFHRFDLSYTGNVKFLSQNGSVTLGVQNLLDEVPPFDDVTGGPNPFNNSLYSPLNRNFYVNYRHAF